MGDHREIQGHAVEADAAAQRALLAGQEETARREFARAAQLYRASWSVAPPGSWGRMVGMLKAEVLAGGAVEAAAREAHDAIGPDDIAGSPAAAWADALASLILGEDARAVAAADAMEAGGEQFARAAGAVRALATGDAAAYAIAVGAIVTDFEARTEHLTGVAIADTALVLEQLATGRDMAAGIESPVLP